MIKAIIFDLDGVLVDADKWHYNALNVALQHSEVEPISWQEHLTIYKGIPTRNKLEILTQRKGLPIELWPKVNESKQEITVDIISKFCSYDEEKVEMMKLLKRKYKVIVCSNAIKNTVQLMLEKSGVLPFVDFYLSNQDVAHPKPNPEIYFKAFEMARFSPEECVIVEDSDVGKKAAIDSGGVLCSVNNPYEVNYYRILRTIMKVERVNFVIPAAGQGKRFSEVGYQHPKPLIDVNGKPMIQLVLENIKGTGRPLLLMQKKHIDQYCVNDIFKFIEPSAEVIPVDGLTEGAVCTVLLARDFINNESELVIANSDQLVDTDLEEFIADMRSRSADGGMMTFKDIEPKWSYAEYDESGKVSRVAEKEVISDQATVGIYYYKRGSDFVQYAEQMIRKGIRVNGEFYVCPVFNEFIQDNKKILIYEIEKSHMHGLGTPEDLQRYLELN